MTNPQVKTLVQSSFLSDFIMQDSPVVDKTVFIQQLLEEPIGSYLLCRPRGFGKTLLLDTIEKIFNGERELFKKMAIGQEETNYDWEVFPVIRLDMSGTHSSADALSRDLVNKLSLISETHHVQIDTMNERSAILSLITRISEKHKAFARENNITIFENDPCNVVLLIDEYDFPLQQNFLHFDKTIEIRHLLSLFFSAIKSIQNRIRFALITGMTKLDDLGLASGMDNIFDISYKSRYSQMCGFTMDEIRKTFNEHLQSTLGEMKANGDLVTDATIDDLISEFERRYSGYSWDGQKTVLNPRSVMDCLNNEKFVVY